MQPERIIYLLEQYISNTARDGEVEELFSWLRQEQHEDKVIKSLLAQMAAQTPPDKRYDPRRWEAVIQSILAYKDQEEPQITTPVRPLWPMRKVWSRFVTAAVAVILLVIAGKALWFHKKEPAVATNNDREVQKDILPGRNKATLTLSNGRKIILESTNVGFLTQEGSTRISKADSDRLTYTLPGGPITGTAGIAYNELTTPIGGQFQVTLPDGSRVWLNAASSIKFPTAFAGKERKVEIRGEAYFEVTKDKNRPFHVETNDMEILVLGTQFDISAYPDERVTKTTLLNGSVRVDGKEGKGSFLLRPGQQVQDNPQQPLRIIDNTNAEQILAWKRGMFSFDHADFKTVIRHLSRWYPIEVVYEKDVPAGTFTGEIPRSLTLVQVLKLLGSARVHFRIEEGNRIVILP